MESELRHILISIPREVDFSDILELHKLEERTSAVGVLHANTIGVNLESIEFCPNNEPPLFEEAISWIWVIRPDLGNDIMKQSISADLRRLISSYKNDEMDNFWDYISE